MEMLGKILVLVLISSAWANNTPSNRLMKSLRNGAVYNLTNTIQYGMDIAKSSCKQVFQWDRWNCPESAFLSQNQLLTKEFAYIQAIMAAGILYAITQSCSKGEIENCGCNTHLNVPRLEIPLTQETNSNIFAKFGQTVYVRWSWGGCSDDVRAADQIVKRILQKKTEYDVQNFIEEQNMQLGRMIVKESLVKRCKCQDISNCAIQTCSLQLAPFIEIAQKIKDIYRRAQHINAEKFTRNTFKTANILNSFTSGMIYLDESPDYCLRNLALGSTGTEGRKCSKSNHENVKREEKHSCKNLCRHCGLGIKKLKRTAMKKCNCRFRWCCEVTCDTCEEEVEEYYCELQN